VTAVRPHLLDSSAVLAWLFREPGGAMVEPVLARSAITTVNLAEVLRRAEARGYLRSSDELAADLGALIDFEDVVAELDAKRCAELVQVSYAQRDKRKTPALSLGDGMCIAVAERLELPVMTSDRAWKDLEDLFRVEVALIR
jgi:ribonuclease VapC